MTTQKEDIGLRIRNRRELLGYSRDKLSDMAGISTQLLAEIERGRKSVTVQTLVGISQALGVTADYILTGYDETVSLHDASFEGKVLDLFSGLADKEKEIGLDMMRIYVKALADR